MARDPAFLFYDGDAARDVSHMNRLERGCYFDLLQAQRKFGSFTVEQARKILGKDFNECWPALEMILTTANDDKYCIEWVAISTKKREEHAEKQRIRIQSYWDKKKSRKNLRKQRYRGKSVDLPLENENEIENEINNKGGYRGKNDLQHFESLWSQYPNKLGKKDALRHYKASVLSDQDQQDIETALQNYIKHTNTIDAKYIKHGSTWFNNWRDWVDYKPKITKANFLDYVEEVISNAG